MKKVIAALLACTLLFALCACAKTTTTTSSSAATASASTAAASASTSTAASGSASSAAASDSKITLDIIISQYSDNTQAWWAADGDYIKAFEDANPNIDLNVEVVSWNDLYTVVNTRISTNQAPDILNIDTFADYVSDDLLEPTGDYVSADLKAKIIPSFWNASEMDGTVWALPILASVRAMFYNKDILAQAGVDVPTTWDELTTALQAVKDKCPGIVPWGLDISTDEGQAAFAYYTWNNGGGFTDADGNWALNSDANVEAMNYIKSLIDNGYCNADPYTDTRYPLQDAFNAGSQAFMIGACNMMSADSKVNYGVTSIPTNNGTSPVALGVCDRLMVFKDEAAEDQDARNAAISKFFDYFYNVDNYSKYMVYEGFLPVTTDSSEQLATKADQYTVGGSGAAGNNEYFATFCNMLGSCNFYPTAKTEWIDVKQGVIDSEQRICQGEDAKTVLDALQSQIAG